MCRSSVDVTVGACVESGVSEVPSDSIVFGECELSSKCVASGEHTSSFSFVELGGSCVAGSRVAPDDCSVLKDCLMSLSFSTS